MMQIMDVSRDPLRLGSIRNEKERILYIYIFFFKGTLMGVHQHTASKENGEGSCVMA